MDERLIGDVFEVSPAVRHAAPVGLVGAIRIRTPAASFRHTVLPQASRRPPAAHGPGVGQFGILRAVEASAPRMRR